jgi:hypothetical protein
MAEINNAVALGIQAPQPQRTSDIIAPITSLAQMQLIGANAERVKAETGQIGLNTQFNQGKLQALSSYNSLIQGGATPETALQKSGLAAYDPAGATAMLGNIKGGMELGAVRNYKPGDANSLASGGPALVGTELENQNKAAATQKTSLESIEKQRQLQANKGYAAQNPDNPLAIAGPEYVGKDLANQKTTAETQQTKTATTEKQMQLYGQVGNVMASDPSPNGRQMAVDLARKAGVDENMIHQFVSMTDDQYMLAGRHLQAAAMNSEPYLNVTGQKDYNQGIAKVATSQEKVGPGETISRGPAAYAVTHGQPIPGNPALGTPPSGVVGPPSLGNFSPPGSTPPAVTPAAPTLPAQAAPGPAATPVRNVNAVAVPSVGVAIAPEITAAAQKYESQRPGLAAYLGRTSQIESGGNPNAYNAQSKAAGPFQFVPSTGAAYLNGKSPFDLAGSADAAARLALDNDKALTKSLGRAPTDAELYLAHQQGAGGAAKLLANPNARAGDLVGNSAIASNGGNPNAPASAFTNLWATKFNGGVGKSLPGAATSPNVTPTADVPASAIMPGAIAPLSAGLQSAPSSAASSEAPQIAPIPQPPPTAAPAPAPAVATAPAPLASAISPSGAPPPTGTAADNVKPLLPTGYQPTDVGPSKSTIAEQEQQGAAYGKLPEELDKAAAAAKTTNTTLDEMATASDGWRMGKWANAQQDAREKLQAVAKTFGVATPDLDKTVGNYQDFAKLSGNILRQASHDTSSRVGVQEMQLISKSLPNPEMSEGGFKLVASQLKGLNDFSIAKQQAAANWRAANGGSLGPNKSGQDFQASWNSNASPAAFIIHRMQQENPDALQNLISTMSKTPEGQTALKNLRGQLQTANDSGWFGK